MDDDEGVDEAVAIVVERSVVDVGIRQQRRIARHRPRVRLRVVDARLAAGVRRQRTRQAVRPDDLPGQQDQVVADLAEVLAHAAGRNPAGGKEEIAEVIRGARHRRVGEVDEDDDHAHLAAERRPARRGFADGFERRAERKLAAGNDQAVVEAGTILRFEGDAAERKLAARDTEAIADLKSQLGAGRDETAILIDSKTPNPSAV